MLRRHLVKLVNAATSLISENQRASFQIQVSALTLACNGDGQPSGGGRVPAYEYAAWRDL